MMAIRALATLDLFRSRTAARAVHLSARGTGLDCSGHGISSVPNLDPKSLDALIVEPLCNNSVAEDGPSVAKLGGLAFKEFAYILDASQRASASPTAGAPALSPAEPLPSRRQQNATLVFTGFNRRAPAPTPVLGGIAQTRHSERKQKPRILPKLL
jgi:hypothetical protein